MTNRISPNAVFPDKRAFQTLARSGNAVFVCKERIADFLTPVALLDRFYRLRSAEERSGIFLFESREESRQTGRYSYLGLAAAKKIVVTPTDVQILHHDRGDQLETIPHNEKPLETLRAVCARIRPSFPPELPDLPFGLVGCFTYEMVSLFDSVPVHETGGDPLAFFVVPSEMIVFDNLKQRLYLCVLSLNEQNAAGDASPANEPDYDAACARLAAFSDELDEAVRQPPAEKPEPSPTVRLRPLLATEDFDERVEKVRREIVRGEIIQLVLSQPFVSPAAPDPIQLYRAQRLINPSPYMFFFHFDETILAGSSPETMIRLKNGQALVRPIAGTRRRGETDDEDRALADELLSDEKERAEHLMLVDLGRNDLGRVARPGTVTVNRLMAVERYSHVMHLVSDVTAELDDGFDAFDLFQAAFPAGTLSGAPKIRAMQLIHQYEDFPRRCYGGAVGYITFNGEMDFAITIRTAEIRRGELTVQAGAGIVFDSDPERERIETINKARALSEATEMIPILDGKGTIQ